VATEDQIDQAVKRLTDTLDLVRADLPGDPEPVVRQALFLLAVRELGGRNGLAEAALTCSEVDDD